MIISIVGQKGGSGKTTLSINIAYGLSERGHRILLLDGDPQGSIIQWQSIADNQAFDVSHYAEATIHDDIERISKGYKHVVIDTPPGGSEIVLSALLCSRLAIIPCGPSPLDLWSAKEFLGIIPEIRKRNKRLQTKLLISQKVSGTILGNQARSALEEFKRSIFKTEIYLRTVYAKSLVMGQAVIEFEPHTEASQEIRSLIDEIL
jgi:chromosome partitioning protein